MEHEQERQPYVSSGKEVLAEAAVMLLVAVAVYFYGDNTKVMSIAVAAILIGRFVLLNRSGDWAFFLLGFVLGGGNDLVSMWREVYYYNPPTILPVPIPVWMLFFWGEAFLFFRRIMRFGPFLGEDAGGSIWTGAFILDLFIIVIYRVIVYRWASVPWMPGALYAFILAARLVLIPPAANERRLMASVLVLGPFYEALLIRGGLYTYQNPVFLGMPLWLITYWIFIIRFAKSVVDRIEHALADRTPRRQKDANAERIDSS